MRGSERTAGRSTKDDKETQVGESKGVEQDLAAERPQPEEWSGIWCWSASGFGRMLN